MWDGTADTAPLVRAAFPILLGLVGRQDVLKAPSLRAASLPGIVVALHATRPHQRIDGAATAQNVPERHVELAVVQLGNRRDREVPIQRAADVVEPDAWIGDCRSRVSAARFNDQDLGARL